MENFVFSLNSTLPIFLLILLGYGLKCLGMLGEKFVKEANQFNFTVTLPTLLFQDIMSADVAREFDLGFLLFCAGATTVSFFGIWLAAGKVLKNRRILGEFVQAAFRCSAAVMGIAFVRNIYGDSGMAPMMIIGTVPLLNIYSVLVLTFEAPENGESPKETKAAGRDRMREALINIAKNPIIIGILLGLLAALVHLKLPLFLERSVGYVADLATPLALVCLGAAFEGRKALAKMKPALCASLIKLVVMPGAFLPLALWLGYRREALVALVVMLASPTTPSCYIMAKNMGHEGVLTSSVVVLTTLFAAVTLTLWLFLLRSLGCI